MQLKMRVLAKLTRTIFTTCIIFCLLAVLGCAGKSQSEIKSSDQPMSKASAGQLDVKFTVGPMTPVARPGAKNDSAAAQWLAGKSLLIYNETGNTLVEKLPIEEDGSCQASLAPGTYQLDMNLPAMHKGKSLPRTIEIQSGTDTRVEVKLDTGIR